VIRPVRNVRSPGYSQKARNAAAIRSRVLPRAKVGSLSLRKSVRLARSSPGPEGRPWARQVFLALLFVLAQFVFIRGELFKVQTVTVTGQKHISQKAVLERSGLKTGEFLWSMTPHQVEMELTRLPQVRSSHVSYGLPGRVNIAIQERQPVIQVACRSNRLAWFAVDEEGVILRSLPTGSNRLPRLVVDEPVLAGTHLDANTLWTVSKTVAQVGKVMPEAVWYYYVDDRGGVTIKTAVARTPLEVHLGPLERMDYKVRILGALLDKLSREKQKVLSVDLRFASPVVKLRTPPPPPAPAPTT